MSRPLDLIGAALGRAEVVAVPVARIAPAFFTVASGVAGAVAQKFVNYRLRLVVVGDVAEHVAMSTALRDYVREANRGGQTWFVADEPELAARLCARGVIAGDLAPAARRRAGFLHCAPAVGGAGWVGVARSPEDCAGCCWVG